MHRRPRAALRFELLEDRRVPSTITPTTFADGGLGSGSLRDAVLQFNADSGTDDDTVLLEAGTYALTIRNSGGRHETAGLTGDLNLNQTSHRWIIQGTGSSGDNETVIDAGELQDRIFQIVTPGTQVVFRDLVIQGGLAQDDGSDGALAGTTDALGGGLLNNGGDVTFDNVVVRNNVARGGDAVAGGERGGHNARGGAIYSTGGALTLPGATLANNQAFGGRGADYPWGPGDGGSASGGGLYASGGFLDIANSLIANNRATGGRSGDGYYYRTYNGSVTTTVFVGGSGGTAQGGGLYVSGGALTLATSTSAANQASGGAPGLYGVTGTSQGGGLYNSGTLTVTDSAVSGSAVSGSAALNGSYTSGGGIYNEGTLTVMSSTLSGNAANGYSGSGGGGISNTGTLTVSNSTLSGNSATGYGHGGGIFNNGTLTITGSTLSGNSAWSAGGIANGGMLTVSNSTLSGNSAWSDGGGIYPFGTRPVTLTNVTFTANRANTSGGSGRGGGLFVAAGLPVLHNTLIAGNFRGATGTTRDDVYGALDSAGDNNLIGDGTGMTGLSDGVNGNQVGTAAAPIDPLLGPLQDNGGPTLTHALLPGSPAIDAGNNAYASEWDQRGPGFSRIVNGIIDIGAFEVQDGGSGPGRLSRPGVKPLPLHVATLLDRRLSQPVSDTGSETKPNVAVIDTLLANDSATQSVLLVRWPEVGEAPQRVHKYKGSRQGLTQADAFDLFGQFSL
jgi:hypothetical protein